MENEETARPGLPARRGGQAGGRFGRTDNVASRSRV